MQVFVKKPCTKRNLYVSPSSNSSLIRNFRKIPRGGGGIPQPKGCRLLGIHERWQAGGSAASHQSRWPPDRNQNSNLDNTSCGLINTASSHATWRCIQSASKAPPCSASVSLGFCTRYSSISTETSTAVGTETMAPSTPPSSDPISNATRIEMPGKPTRVPMIRGTRNEFSTCTQTT